MIAALLFHCNSWINLNFPGKPYTQMSVEVASVCVF